MDYKQSLQLVKERAVVRYGFKQGNLLRYLTERVHPGKNKNKDIGFIEKTVKVSTLQQKIGFLSERHLRRLLDDLRDVVLFTWENKAITYKLNLKPLVEFDYEGALKRMADEHEAKRQERTAKARQKYAADRQKRKLEETQAFLKALPSDQRRNILAQFKEKPSSSH